MPTSTKLRLPLLLACLALVVVATRSPRPAAAAPSQVPTVPSQVPTAPHASLRLETSSSTPHLPPAGHPIRYGFVVTNTGATIVDRIVVGSHATDVRCPTASLAPRGSMTCIGTHVVTVADQDAGAVVNVAVVHGATRAVIPRPVQAVANTVAVAGKAGLSVANSTAMTDLPAAGSTVRFQYLVRSTGSVTVGRIAVRDPGSTNIWCPMTSLRPDESMVCTGDRVVTAADRDRGRVTSRATVVGTPPSTVPPLGEVSSDELVVPYIAAIEVEVSPGAESYAEAGETMTYEVEVTNAGTVPLAAVAVAGEGFDAPPGCPRASLEPRESMACTASRRVTPDDVSARSASTTATAVATSPNGEQVRSEPAAATVPFGPASLRSADAGAGPPGDAIAAMPPAGGATRDPAPARTEGIVTRASEGGIVAVVVMTLALGLIAWRQRHDAGPATGYAD